MKSIFDSSFKYTPSFDTDVRRTFDRIRREQQATGSRPSHGSASGVRVKVLPLDLLKQGA